MELVEKVDFPWRSQAGWHWALFENPQQGDIPAGFVAERDGRVVAMVGLQARDFILDGTPVKAATGHTFIAGQEGRGSGPRLARRALTYPGLAAVYSLNNNASSAGLYKKLGMKAWRGETARSRLEWPVRPLSMGVGVAFSRLARSDRMYDALSAREWFKVRHTPLADHARQNLQGGDWLDPANPDHAHAVADFDFELRSTRQAVPVRSALFYAYQLSDPDAPGRSVVLTTRNGSKISGLMLAILSKPNAYEPAGLDIVDLEVAPGAPRAATIGRLMRSARKIARASGVARLRLIFSDRFATAELKGSGLRLHRRFSYDPAHALFADENGKLAESWIPTGYEGDFHFALRVAPQRAPR
ncbi:GNAT family N-acetyltransferase [Henriciella barbarensis]|uniref:GNAT family N-acetyltransferase n=2 Tax=Henriciella barbarensis TaxID=86342 RepID=A0A399QT64_9PROT|nr:GNAT family N-acetyltransferase [Henriciella barbarensis]